LHIFLKKCQKNVFYQPQAVYLGGFYSFSFVLQEYFSIFKYFKNK